MQRLLSFLRHPGRNRFLFAARGAVSGAGGGRTHFVLAADGSARFEQERDGARAAGLGSVVERAVAELVAAVRVRAGGEEEARGLGLVSQASDVQC